MTTLPVRACSVLVLMALGLAMLAGCGSSGSGSGSAPAPTVTAVAPGSGTSLGGTLVTISGSAFSEGVSGVTFGGNPATGIAVGSDAQLTCLTPPGVPGSVVSVQVQGPGGTGSLASAFAYHPAPSVSAVYDDRGSTSGGLEVTVTGAGFAGNAAGTNAVTFDGVAASAVMTLDDATITCRTPAGAAGAADVAVTNANGTGLLPSGFLYIVPLLYAADGRNGVSGNLYLIDPSDGSATTIGPIGFPITGLAFTRDGVLYGATSAKAEVQSLVTINVQTGVGTLVAPLADAGAAEQGCTDITFVGDRLLGWGQPLLTLNQRLLEIDPVSGLVTDLGGGQVFGGGGALESDRLGAVRLITTSGTNRTIYDVDPLTGVATTDKDVTPDGPVLNSMTFLDGVLYVVESDNVGLPPTTLTTLDVASGALTPVGALPVSVDAIAGTVK